MHDARAVGNFFIDVAIGEKRSLTIMTLLKIIYFSHAWHLVKYNKPLVGQPFEAWKDGPVSRVVYDQFKKVPGGVITNKLVSFDPVLGKFCTVLYSFDADLAIFLNEMYAYYSKFHAFKLSDLTHEKGAPWDLIWNAANNRAVPGMVIPNEMIHAWFSERRALYWSSRRQEHPS